MKILEKRWVSKSNVKSFKKVPGLGCWTLLVEYVYVDESSDVEVALITNSGIVPVVFISPAAGIGIDSLECRFAVVDAVPLLLLLLFFDTFAAFSLEVADLCSRLIVGKIPEKSSVFLTGVDEVLLAGEFELLLRA